MTQETVALVTQLGERIPGQSSLSALQEPVRELWPAVTNVYRTPAASLMIRGEGFIANKSYCLLETSSTTIRLLANVSSNTSIHCPLNETTSQPILAVQIENEIASDLSQLLKSAKINVETESFAKPNETAAVAAEEPTFDYHSFQSQS